MAAASELLTPCSIDFLVSEHSFARSIDSNVYGDNLYKSIALRSEVVGCSEWIEESLFGMRCEPSISNNLPNESPELLIGQIHYTSDNELFVSMAIKAEQYAGIEEVVKASRNLTLSIRFEAPHGFTVSLAGHRPITGFSLTDEPRAGPERKSNRILNWFGK